MQFIDTHCHLDMSAFDADRDAVLARAAHAGVRRMLVPALDLASARRVLKLTETHSQLSAAVGIHPTEVAAAAPEEIAGLEPLLNHLGVVAVGEIGLDYYWIAEDAWRSRQQEILQAQLELAGSTQKPVVLHMREQRDADAGPCAQDLLAILRDWVLDLRSRGAELANRPGVLHSFSGSLDVALQAIDLGFCIGVTGPVTFPNAERRRRVVAALPLDRVLIETDAPFLAPQAHRGRRNEPAFVADIADRIAQVQGRTLREVADATSTNAERLFNFGALA